MNYEETKENDMKKYIGVKIVEAELMGSEAASKHLGRRVSPKNTGTIHNAEYGSHPGYLVRYEDGYESWCPRIQFEKANRPCDAMTFGMAIEAAKAGMKIARKGWNGKGLSVELQVPDEHSKMTLPYLYMNYPSTPASDTAPENHINARVPWLASQPDMLSEDWEIVQGVQSNGTKSTKNS